MLHAPDWHAACRQPGMLMNYFRTAWRNLLRHKSIAVINLAGLSIGFTFCMLIALYLQHELRYEDFQQKGHRIARVIMEYRFGTEGQSSSGDFTSMKVAPHFQQNFPEVESAVRMSKANRVIRRGEHLQEEKNFYYADSTFFRIFTYPLLQGNPQTALVGPDKVVLTTSTARRYFGTENPIGKTILVGTGAKPFEVTGITADCPTNSMIRYDFLASFTSIGIQPHDLTTYWNANVSTYLLLKDVPAIATLQAKLPFYEKGIGGHRRQHQFSPGAPAEHPPPFRTRRL